MDNTKIVEKKRKPAVTCTGLSDACLAKITDAKVAILTADNGKRSVSDGEAVEYLIMGKLPDAA
jgi:hypothetical protein